MELASLQVNAAASPDEPLARFAIAAPVLANPGEAVCRLVQVRWREGAPRERATSVRGQTEMQALCLAIRLMISVIGALAQSYGQLVDADGDVFDVETLGLIPFER